MFLLTPVQRHCPWGRGLYISFCLGWSSTCFWKSNEMKDSMKKFITLSNIIFSHPTISLRIPPFFMIFCHDYFDASPIMIERIRILHSKGVGVSLAISWDIAPELKTMEPCSATPIYTAFLVLDFLLDQKSLFPPGVDHPYNIWVVDLKMWSDSNFDHFL